MHLFLRIFARCVALLILAACSSSGVPVRGGEDPSSAILAVMDAQVEAWNRGDIEGFLEGYVKSPDLLFASRGTFSRGWEPLLERYRTAYPEGKMGRLSFGDIEVNPMGENAAWVVGHWALEMEDSSPHGAFTLIFVRNQEGWRILHDHSSGVPEAASD